MTDAVFLASICENPQDDAPRLILADFLEEHGDSDRAEFIRVQCELASIGLVTLPDGTQIMRTGCEEDDRRERSLRRRERELLTTPSPGCPRCVRWAPEVVLRATGWRKGKANSSAWNYRRGFIESLTCTTSQWLENGPEVLAAVPTLREVRLSDKEPAVQPMPERWLPERQAWWWESDIQEWRVGTSALPTALFNLLHGGEIRVVQGTNGGIFENRVHISPTSEDAQKSLSLACLAYGRSRLPHHGPINSTSP